MPNRGQHQPPRRNPKQPGGPGTFSPDDDETAQSEETLQKQAENAGEMEDQPEAGEAEEENQRH
jgi:hypothetical protein